MKRRLIKFDIVHPPEYLEQKKKSWPDLPSISRQEYLDRLIRLRSNYSDFYTYHLDPEIWEAEEFFLLDSTFWIRPPESFWVLATNSSDTGIALKTSFG